MNPAIMVLTEGVLVSDFFEAHRPMMLCDYMVGVAAGICVIGSFVKASIAAVIS